MSSDYVDEAQSGADFPLYQRAAERTDIDTSRSERLVELLESATGSEAFILDIRDISVFPTQHDAWDKQLEFERMLSETMKQARISISDSKAKSDQKLDWVKEQAAVLIEALESEVNQLKEMEFLRETRMGMMKSDEEAKAIENEAREKEVIRQLAEEFVVTDIQSAIKKIDKTETQRRQTERKLEKARHSIAVMQSELEKKTLEQETQNYMYKEEMAALGTVKDCVLTLSRVTSEEDEELVGLQDALQHNRLEEIRHQVENLAVRVRTQRERLKASPRKWGGSEVDKQSPSKLTANQTDEEHPPSPKKQKFTFQLTSENDPKSDIPSSQYSPSKSSNLSSSRAPSLDMSASSAEKSELASLKPADLEQSPLKSLDPKPIQVIKVNPESEESEEKKLEITSESMRGKVSKPERKPIQMKFRPQKLVLSYQKDREEVLEATSIQPYPNIEMAESPKSAPLKNRLFPISIPRKTQDQYLVKGIGVLQAKFEASKVNQSQLDRVTESPENFFTASLKTVLGKHIDKLQASLTTKNTLPGDYDASLKGLNLDELLNLEVETVGGRLKLLEIVLKSVENALIPVSDFDKKPAVYKKRTQSVDTEGKKDYFGVLTISQKEVYDQERLTSVVAQEYRRLLEATARKKGIKRLSDYEDQSNMLDSIIENRLKDGADDEVVNYLRRLPGKKEVLNSKKLIINLMLSENISELTRKLKRLPTLNADQRKRHFQCIEKWAKLTELAQVARGKRLGKVLKIEDSKEVWYQMAVNIKHVKHRLLGIHSRLRALAIVSSEQVQPMTSRDFESTPRYSIGPETTPAKTEKTISFLRSNNVRRAKKIRHETFNEDKMKALLPALSSSGNVNISWGSWSKTGSQRRLLDV